MEPKRWMSNERLEHNFTYHAPNAEKAKDYETLRGMGRNIAVMIQVMCPEVREKSLAITKIEEAIMWANASIARDTEDAPK